MLLRSSLIWGGDEAFSAMAKHRYYATINTNSITTDPIER